MNKATSKAMTEEQKAELAALETLATDRIDTSDLPEVVNWPDVQGGPFYRPVKKQITSRLDDDVLT